MPDGIGESTAVGVDQSAKQQIWSPCNDPQLPRGERDPAIMLPSGAVLREQADQLFRVGADLHRPRILHRLHVLAVRRQQLPHCLAAFADNAGVALVESDSEPKYPPRAL